MDLTELHERWTRERDRYKACATEVGEKLQTLTLRQGIRCVVTSRAKEVDSLLKKQLRYEFPDPWEQITDKAGVRVIAPYEDWIEDTCSLIKEHFDVAIDFDRKVDTLGADRVGYLGIHVHVTLREGPYQGLVCEVQLHTGAQHLWAAASHELFYKSMPGTSPLVVRNFNRLIVLMELFDKEVSECRAAVMNMPDQDSHKILRLLEKYYFSIAARPYDQDLSLHVITTIKGLFTTEELSDFERLISEFVNNNRQKLEQIYQRYGNDPRHIMLFQPEALIVFERVRRHRMELRRRWSEVLPANLLNSLITIWGA